MIVDAHQHFWQVARGDYGWLTPDLEPLFRDFMPGDLAPHLAAHGIDGTVLVQAAPTVAETAFLLELAEREPAILGVVGWVDFEAASAPEDIARLAAHPKLVGLRPMIQDIADDRWMLRADLAPAWAAMAAADLVFDALVFPRHLPHLRRLLARHADLRVVIDHGAKPRIAAGEFDAWAREMAAIARESRALCKLSGLLTEAGPDWTAAQVAPYVRHLLDCFGTERLIWGSDWPVLTLAASYARWFDLAQALVPEGAARARIFGQTAVETYRLRPR